MTIVPLHHANATKYLAEQRELALQRPVAEAGGEANSMASITSPRGAGVRLLVQSVAVKYLSCLVQV